MIRLMLVLALTLTLSPLADGAEVDLLAYMQAQIRAQSEADIEVTRIEPYNRTKHFGTWKDQDPSRPCQNTRATVLTMHSDPQAQLTYTSAKKCTVATGLWHESYTGADYTRAADLQVDHVVPLKNAYYAGAHAWSAQVRCHFSNFIGNDFHLEPVDAHENMSKSDHAPDRYLPSNGDDHCRYLNAWMKIKIIWELSTTASEVEAIQQTVRTKSCARSFLVMDSEDLSNQRVQASTPIPACRN